MIEKYIQDALIIWTTIDPFGTLAIFTALTANLAEDNRRTVALKTVLYAGAVLIGAIVIGQLLLAAMGIRFISFQLGGGIILFLFGLQMIFGTPFSGTKQEPGHDIAVFPLAIPVTATPGAILAVMLLTDNHIHPIPVQVGTLLITVGILLITYLFLLFSNQIIKVIGLNGASIMTRVMGMILAAFSVELVMNALGVEQWGQSSLRSR